jgi:hypothetical protein
MSAIDNLGGFVTRPNEHSLSASSSLAPTPMAPTDTNNPYRRPSPTLNAPDSSTMVARPEFLLDVSYPSHAPPSYDSITSPAPSVVILPGKSDLQTNPGFSVETGSTAHQAPQPSQYPMPYGVPGSSQPSQLSQQSRSSQPLQPPQLPAAYDTLDRAQSSGLSQQPNLMYVHSLILFLPVPTDSR